jgi:hypothetical protein
MDLEIDERQTYVRLLAERIDAENTALDELRERLRHG